MFKLSLNKPISNKFRLGLAVMTVAGLVACSDDGAVGLNSLLKQTALSIGHETCRNGGLQIDSGIDANVDGILDNSEINASEYLCNESVKTLTANDVLANTNSHWYVESAEQVEIAQQNINQIIKTRGKAKNIILFVGDGMGVSTVTAARILDGQNKGMLGEENSLSFEKFEFSGLAKTYNVDSQTPDSAGTMTAMMTGVKTNVGVIGVNEMIARGECATATGNLLVNALELAEINGLSTGILSTARITHATPAATYANSVDRNWEDISDMPAEAISAGCKDIADQLVNFEANLEARYEGLDIDGIEVIMGGGRRHFLPKDMAFNSSDAVSSVEGDRTDSRDLIAEWKANYTAGTYVMDQNGFDAIDTEATGKILGLFNESHMQYEADRSRDIAGEPSLTEMTKKAIGVLDNNEKGFFLMVESGRIDHAHHAGNAYNALVDTIELSKAVEAAMAATNPEETLIIVTADHSHVFTIAGYPKRGNPILGKVINIGATEPALASDDMPYTTVGYTNGLGFHDLGAETNADAIYSKSPVTGRSDLSFIDTQAAGFHQEALVPKSSETHAGEDVVMFASGPGAQLVNGTNEQNIIFHVMDFAGDLVNRADKKIN
jgi:alkaline phosphatase